MSNLRLNLMESAFSANEARNMRLSNAWRYFDANSQIKKATQRGQKYASIQCRYYNEKVLEAFVEAAKMLKYKVRVYKNSEGKTVTLRWD